MRLQYKCFPMKFTKFLRTPILKNICERLLLWFETWHTLWHNFIFFLLFYLIPQQILKFLFIFHFVKLIASKFRQWVQFSIQFSIYFSRDSLCFIHFDVIICQWLKKKFKLVKLFFQLSQWSKNKWSCAKTDTGFWTKCSIKYIS